MCIPFFLKNNSILNNEKHYINGKDYYISGIYALSFQLIRFVGSLIIYDYIDGQ